MKQLYNYLFLIAVLAGLAHYEVVRTAGVDRDKSVNDSIKREWFYAAVMGDLKTLEKLIDQVNVNARDVTHDSALMIAVRLGHEKIFERLLKVPGIDVNIRDGYKYTPLIRAAMNGNESMVKQLLARDIDINARNEYGVTALMAAVINSSSKPLIYENVVKLVIQFPGIDLNLKNKHGETVFMRAACYASENIVKLLLQAPGIDITCKDFNEIRYKRANIAKLIQSKQAFDALSSVAKATTDTDREHHIEMLKKIITQIGATDSILDQDGNTLLDRAFAAHKPDIIVYLLQNSQDPRELLARFPFEAVSPSSDIFKLCMELAYASESKPKICAHCARQCEQLCSGCKKNYYCSVECQKADWPNHKDSCKKL